MKSRLIAISLLVALAGWMFIPPPKTVASQSETKIVEVISPSDVEVQTNTRPDPSSPPNRSTTITSKQPRLLPPSGRDYTGRIYSKEEVQQLIHDYSVRYGISPDLPLRIAYCESGYNQFAKNKTSTASGVFQYLASTWQVTDQGKIGLSVFDADANVKAAVSYIASRGHARPWAASQHCWSK